MQAQSSGKGLYRFSLLLGLLAAAELIFMLLPSARPLMQLLDLIKIFFEHIHPSLGILIGQSVSGRLAVGTGLVWLASWLALEAFSRATDEISLWGNIFEDSCGRAPRGLKRTLCTACKWAITISLAPAFILLALLRRVRYGTRSVTAGFVTLDPRIIMNYMRHFLIGLVVVATTVAFLFGAQIT